MKRGKGERGKVLFDTLDLKIMKALKTHKIGVMELRDKVGLKHKNLKIHVDKLKRLDLIRSKPVPKSRKQILSISQNNETKLLITLLEKCVKERRRVE